MKGFNTTAVCIPTKLYMVDSRSSPMFGSVDMDGKILFECTV